MQLDRGVSADGRVLPTSSSLELRGVGTNVGLRSSRSAIRTSAASKGVDRSIRSLATRGPGHLALSARRENAQAYPPPGKCGASPRAGPTARRHIKMGRCFGRLNNFEDIRVTRRSITWSDYRCESALNCCAINSVALCPCTWDAGSGHCARYAQT
jgi:hypothetical protein